MRLHLIALLLCCLLLAGCSVDPISRMSSPSETDLPAPVVDDLPSRQDEVILWFRYAPEGMLAPETRVLDVTDAQSLAQPLLEALLDGPSAASVELRGLFPQGTKLVSLSQTGGTLFVTLSHHILDAYPDEPADWQSDPYWAVEAPLRRKLAMQSIVATLTENGPADALIVLVAADDTADSSLRLDNSYFRDGRKGVASAIHRDESLLLTPLRTAEIVLQCWQETDWVRLHRYLARTDTANGDARPAEGELPALLADLPRLVRFDVSGGSTLGSQAMFTYAGAHLDGTAERPFTGHILRLTYERGLWRVGLSQLTEGGASK